MSMTNMRATDVSKNRKREIDKAFRPKSIAVLGASDDKTKFGGRLVAAIINHGYQGELFPINPRGVLVQGLPSYKSLADVGKPIDFVIVCLPQELVEQSLEAAGRVSAGAVLVYASGYAEKDAEGQHAQARMVAIARKHGFVLIGPNCLGLVNGAAKLAATSTVLMDFVSLEPGSLALATQSGALGTYWLDEALDAGLGIGKWVSTGNEADLSTAEILNYFVNDDETRIVSAYIESASHGDRLRKALLAAAAKEKPVIVLRSGRSKVGAKAVATHTGSLAGEDRIMTSLLDQYGVCQAGTLTEMIDLAKIFATQSPSTGRRACIISLSGGAGALIADAATAAGFQIPDVSDQTLKLLGALFPSYAKLSNPIDLTDRVIRDEDLLGRVLDVMLASNEFDAILVFVSGRNFKAITDYTSALTRHFPVWKGSHAAIWKSAPAGLLRSLQKEGVAVFNEIDAAVTALGRAVNAADRRSHLVASPAKPKSVFKSQIAMTERSSKDYLRAAGLPVPASMLVTEASQVDAAFAKLSGRVAVKLQSRDILHKSGHGGISLGLTAYDDVKAEVEKMMSLCIEGGFHFDGVLIEDMKIIEQEFVFGLRNDPNFGSMLTFGRGGTAVEVDPDIFTRFLPVSDADLRTNIACLRMFPLLEGFRGKSPVDIGKLVSVVRHLIDVYESDSSCMEIEINPLAIDDCGNPWILDALVFKGVIATSTPKHEAGL